MSKEQKGSTAPAPQARFKAVNVHSETPAATPEAETPASTGTTERLFADLMPEPTKELPSTKEDAPKEEAKPEKAEVPETKEPDFDVEMFKDRKVKVKVNGKESEVSLKDLIKGYQTDQYLTQKGQRLAEDARIFEETKRLMDLQGLRAENQPQNSETEEDEVYKTLVKPHVAKLQDEIKALNSTISGLTKTIGPIQYQNNLGVVDKALKDEGFDDFMTKVPKIEEHILNLPPEQQMAFDNMGSYMSIYKDMKLKEMIYASKNPPQQKVDARKEPKVVKIESESSQSGADDWGTQYNVAFERAKKTGDWSEVMRLKGF